MAKRIRTGACLKDFTRRDFLVGSALTAALFTAALLLLPPDATSEGKAPETTAPVSSN
ncbi:twin-arginine translocation signal domain-containing protein [Mesorhizobium sp. B2-3-3]|nr:twin-arginine translocation signal domain-containing protein [Mesorhizobium sp. B2-3-3]